MFGYATDETPSLMPLPIHLAHRMAQRLAEVRKSGEMPYLRPDGKTQVTVAYEDGRPVGITAVVLSTQHRAEIDLETLLRPDIEEQVIRPLLPDDIDTDDLRIYVNPTGRFELGGPVADAGLTGRKVIVDTYGGMARHGGGAFSGKDPSKVDRSAAYATRWVAKNIVAAGLARKVELQVAYAIGVATPVSLDRDLRHRAGRSRGDPRRRPRGLRPAARRDHRGARPAQARLPRDRRLRPLRPRGRPVHLGAHRPRRRAARRGSGPGPGHGSRRRRAAGRARRRRGGAAPPRPPVRLPHPRRARPGRAAGPGRLRRPDGARPGGGGRRPQRGRRRPAAARSGACSASTSGSGPTSSGCCVGPPTGSAHRSPTSSGTRCRPGPSTSSGGPRRPAGSRRVRRVGRARTLRPIRRSSTPAWEAYGEPGRTLRDAVASGDGLVPVAAAAGRGRRGPARGAGPAVPGGRPRRAGARARSRVAGRGRGGRGGRRPRRRPAWRPLAPGPVPAVARGPLRRGAGRGRRAGAAWVPLDRLGLAVVLDEANPAFKERRSPRHHVREVVLERRAVRAGSGSPSARCRARSRGGSCASGG
jgi:hypothetical protein